MIIRESCPGDLRGIIGSCRSGRVISFYNSSFANFLPSIYHANAGAVHFPGVAMRGYSTQRLKGIASACYVCPRNPWLVIHAQDAGK